MLLAQVHAAGKRGGALGRHEEAGGADGRGSEAGWADSRRGGREEEDSGGRQHATTFHQMIFNRQHMLSYTQTMAVADYSRRRGVSN
eukprot:scaffold57240_cov69-Phaeocystis_antarctica.AAC.2